MDNVANARINTFGQSPKADFETIELSVSEFENILKDSISVYNLLAEALKDAGIVRGKELARLTTKAQDSIKAARSPCEKLLLINAFVKQLLAKVKAALKTRPQAQGTLRQAITKIQLRAESLVDHIKVLAEGKKEISLTSPQARQFLAGREGKPVSRRDCIRALKRAEKICPALDCGYLGDGRATTRLIAKVQELLSVSCGNGPLGAYS